MTSSLSEIANPARPVGMTNKIQNHGAVVQFILSPEETAIWRRDDWSAAGVRGGVKREARKLWRDILRPVRVVAADGEMLWSSYGDPVCEQVARNAMAKR